MNFIIIIINNVLEIRRSVSEPQLTSKYGPACYINRLTSNRPI